MYTGKIPMRKNVDEKQHGRILQPKAQDKLESNRTLTYGYWVVQEFCPDRSVHRTDIFPTGQALRIGHNETVLMPGAAKFGQFFRGSMTCQ